MKNTAMDVNKVGIAVLVLLILIRLTDAYKLCGIIMKKYGGDVAMFRSESVLWLILSLVLCMFKFVTLRKEDVK